MARPVLSVPGPARGQAVLLVLIAFVAAALMLLGAAQVTTAAGLAPPPIASGDPLRGESLEAGDIAIVRADGDCLRLRVIPGIAGAKITCMPEGSAVTVIGGPVSLDGFTWAQVRTSAGLEGWSANEFLELVSGPLPTPTAPPTPVTSSGSGMPLPASAGSAWSIVAGYNTATHTGSDPWAIDIVRDDASSSGTPVLSPVDGEISYVSSDCLTVDMGDGHLLLLCHIFPASHLQGGTNVSVGDSLGVVAPPGQANNNGLAHIHLAVHTDTGFFGNAVPLVGEYAVEGRDLLPVSTFNAYQGSTFVSSNGAPAAPPSPTPSPTPTPTPEPTLQPVAITPTPTPPPTSTGSATFTPALPSSGTALAVWSGGSISQMAAQANAAASIFVTVNGQLIGYIPGAPPFVNQAFVSTYPSGAIPGGTIFLIKLR